MTALRIPSVPVAALLLSSLACTHRPFLPVEQLPTQPAQDPAEYRIGVGDVLGVRVWNQENMSTAAAKVRDDGRISVPFLQDVEVIGMTPMELASRLQVKLKAYVVNPVVTVTLEERSPIRVSVLGEVRTPGTYEVQFGGGVLHALAAAGGLTDYAHRDGIFVLRQGFWADGNPAPARIRFRFDALSAGDPKAAAFRLRAGDIVVVE